MDRNDRIRITTRILWSLLIRDEPEPFRLIGREATAAARRRK
jgi:hypothetical protein